jgi:hypothetical protein
LALGEAAVAAEAYFQEVYFQKVVGVVVYLAVVDLWAEEAVVEDVG